MEPVTEYKLCKRGHVRSPENLTKHGACRICRNITSHNYYEKNKTDIRNNQLEYYFQNKDKLLLQRRKYKHENRDKVKKKQQNWNLNHPNYAKNKNSERVKNYSDCLVAQHMGFKTKEVSAELLEIKRLQLILKRELKNASNN